MTQVTAHARTRLLRLPALLVLAVSGMVAAFATIAPAPDAGLPAPGMVREDWPVRIEAALLPAATHYPSETRFKRGDTLGDMMQRLGIAEADSGRALRHRLLRQIRPGTTLHSSVDAEGRLRDLSFLAGRETLVRIAPSGDSLTLRKEAAEFRVVTLLRSGVIRSSLFGAADAADVPDSIAIQLADIFGGDIDFHRDLRRGDRFSVVYESITHLGREVRAGRVLAAEFVNRRRVLRAIYYAGEAGVAGFYAPDGSNLRKAFLRSPLEFSRVSSGFGMRRHPFLKTWRAHRGIDYAAPAGTRVRAAGDGVVAFAGRKGGYGNVIILRHPGSITTVYAHLRSFARGVRRGARVAQGETIAYVGSTGWATGPHLHYEFRVGNTARNPLRIAMPAALPVPRAQRARFRQQASPLVGQLDLLAGTTLARAE